MINLNLVDKFLLLALDDEKGSFVSKPFALKYGLPGAILLELSLKEQIKIVDKKVIVNNVQSTGDALLDYCLELLKNSKKNRTLKYWIQSLGNKEKLIKKEVLNKLIVNGILVKREQKFLWIFNNDKFPTVNAKPENSLRKRLYEIITYHKKPNVDELMLISLIDTCDLNSIVYGKERYKKSKQNIKNIIAEAKNSNAISATIKEIHDVILAMIVVIISSSAVTAAVVSS